MCSLGESLDKLQCLSGGCPCRRQQHRSGQSLSQHGVRPAVLRGWHPHACPLPPSVLAPQDPPTPPPLCHLHCRHGDQRLSPSYGVRLSCRLVVQYMLLLIYFIYLLGNFCIYHHKKVNKHKVPSNPFCSVRVSLLEEGFSTLGGTILCWRSCCFLELWLFIQGSWT